MQRSAAQSAYGGCASLRHPNARSSTSTARRSGAAVKTAGRRAIACAVALSVSTGCATKSQGAAALIFGGGVVAGGIALATRPHEAPPDSFDGINAPNPLGVLGFTLIMGGLALMLAGGVGLAESPASQEREPEPKPEPLDRAIVAEGVGKMRTTVMACGDQSLAKGTVSVSVKVAPDGLVTTVRVQTTPDPALGECVAAAIKNATFARTQSGGSFTYPFMF